MSASAVFALLWAALVATLSVHWNANPQYAFGYLVPLLALYLLRARWVTRPSPSAPVGLKWLALAISALFLPTWLILQPCPDWRLVDWLFAAQVVALSLLAWGRVGGWPWVRHFAFPTALIFTAIPWPSAIEAALIQGLTQFVTAITVALLGLIGIPALQHGNVIEIGSGLLGIDEACSGVRSFQAALMAGLFLGELERLSVGRRIVLLTAGIALAIVTNIGRASLLAWTVSRAGPEGVVRWHDPTGFGTLLVCFIALWGVTLYLARDATPPPVNEPGPAPAFPSFWTIGLALWLVAVGLGTELWFRSGAASKPAPWTFSLPREHAGFHETAIDPATAEMLHYQTGRAASWRDNAGGEWLAYHFTWAPGRGRSRVLAHMHRPENCLPAAGWQNAGERAAVALNVGDIAVPFRALRFQLGERTAHVWFCLWEERASQVAAAPDLNVQRAAFRAVARRERALGQQVIEVVLIAPLDDASADTRFREEIAPLLQLRDRESAHL